MRLHLKKWCAMTVEDDDYNLAWINFIEFKSDATGPFKKLLAEVRADGILSGKYIVRSYNGGGAYVCKAFS